MNIKVKVVRIGRPHPDGFQFVCQIDKPFEESRLPLDGDELVVSFKDEENTEPTP